MIKALFVFHDQRGRERVWEGEWEGGVMGG